MAILEELTILEIKDEIAVIERTNYQKIEYPLSWIPFAVKEGDLVDGIVLSCGEGVVSNIHFRER